MKRVLIGAAAWSLLVMACGTAGGDPPTALPPTDPSHMEALLTGSDRPVVLNVWGSWCIPCRSEAPLLRAAVRRFGDEVRFVGVAVRDREAPAAKFVTEFGLEGFEHYLDPSGAVPASLGGRGVPLTFFVRAGGEVDELHAGVIDERTLALRIDELLRSR